jgi:hypothetical protein
VEENVGWMSWLYCGSVEASVGAVLVLVCDEEIVVECDAGKAVDAKRHSCRRR